MLKFPYNNIYGYNDLISMLYIWEKKWCFVNTMLQLIVYNLDHWFGKGIVVDVWISPACTHVYCIQDLFSNITFTCSLKERKERQSDSFLIQLVTLIKKLP